MLELNYLRKHASSFISKLILGVIALIFALYFGFRGGDRPIGGTAPIAKVNGDSIPSGLFNQNVQNQISFYQRLGQQTNNPDFTKVIESQELQRLIFNVLLSQQAEKFGLHISDQELASAIRNDPNLQINGQFNEEFYLKRYKPWYERRNGQDFEYSLREQLLQDRLREVIRQASIVSEQQVKDSLIVKETLLNLRIVEIPFGTDKEKRTRKQAKEIAQQWINAKKENKPVEEILKTHSLEEKEVGLKPLQALQPYFGGTDSIPILFCALQIKPGEICDEPFLVKDTMLTVGLIDRQDNQPNEEQFSQMSQQMERATNAQMLSGVNNFLIRKAKIETFLRK